MIRRLRDKAAAEAIGTFALVFFGCGAIMVSRRTPDALPTIAVPVVFGLVVAAMIYAVGHISGAHFNPAVTLAFTAARRFPWREVPAYWLAQVGGAFAAIAALAVLMPEPAGGYGATTTSLASFQAVGWEGVLTATLMFVIIAVATDARAVGVMAGAAIGAAVTIGAFVGGPMTGASMNPARSLAPAIFEGRLGGLWVYIAGPMIGAVLAAIVYEQIRCEVTPPAHADDGRREAKGCC